MDKTEKSRQGIFSVVASVAANTELSTALEEIMPEIIEITQSNAGAFYLANLTTNRLELTHAIGFSKNIFNEFDINIGEGLIGDISDNNIKIVKDIPEDTIYINRSFLGNIKPKSLMVVPVLGQDTLVGVIVLSSVDNYNSDNYEQAELIRHYVGIAVFNANTYETNQRLNNELRFQNKLIQDLNIELERKALEKNIIFDNVVDSIREYAIYLIDNERIITTWNKGAEELIGFKAYEVIGKHINKIYSEVDVESGLIDYRLDIAKRDGSYTENIWRNRKDGSRYYAELTIYSNLDESGNLMGYIAIIRDITGINVLEESIKEERKFNYELLNLADKSIILTDNLGNIVFCNLLANDRLNIKEEELIYTLFKDDEKIREKYINALENRETQIIENIKTIDNKDISLKIIPIKENIEDISIMIIVELIKWRYK